MRRRGLAGQVRSCLNFQIDSKDIGILAQRKFAWLRLWLITSDSMGEKFRYDSHHIWAQIAHLRVRIVAIPRMQVAVISSFILCVVTMFALFLNCRFFGR